MGFTNPITGFFTNMSAAMEQAASSSRFGARLESKASRQLFKLIEEMRELEKEIIKDEENAKIEDIIDDKEKLINTLTKMEKASVLVLRGSLMIHQMMIQEVHDQLENNEELLKHAFPEGPEKKLDYHFEQLRTTIKDDLSSFAAALNEKSDDT